MQLDNDGAETGIEVQRKRAREQGTDGEGKGGGGRGNDKDVTGSTIKRTSRLLPIEVILLQAL